MTRRGLICALLLCTVLGTAPVRAQETVDIPIASVAPLTGGLARLGMDNENGARLALEEATAAKLRIGGRIARFVLVGEDDRADPKTALALAQKLVAARVAGIIGHLNSGTSIPAGALYNLAGIPAISPSATNPRLTEQGYRGQFRVIGRDDQQGSAIALVLASMTRSGSIAVIDDGTAYGAGTADDVEKNLRLRGLEVVARERGRDRDMDWRPALERLRERKPAAIFFGGMDDSGAPFLRQARELGIQSVFAMADGGCTDSMATLAPGASEGMVCTQNGIPALAVHPSFLEAYRNRFNTQPILYAPFTYDAANLLVAAMVKADSAEPAKYLPELAKLSFVGVTGRIEFDAKGDRKDAEVTIFILKDGRVLPAAVIQGRRGLNMRDYMAELARLERSRPGQEK